MPSLPMGFWAGWVVVLSLGSLIVLALLIYSVYFKKGPEHIDQVWDGDLREGDAPAPMWWFYLVLGLMVFSVIYLLLYPGLGSFPGALKWSQSHHLAHSFSAYRAEFDPISASLLAQAPAELASNEEAMRSARSIFKTQCGGCHGNDARGQVHDFPDLADANWQWGDELHQIETSIRDGRLAVMPAWGEALGTQKTDMLAAYVMSLAHADGDSVGHADGADLFAQTCSACHGQDGKGSLLLGAPDLTDSVWLYGGSKQQIKSVIGDGRNGVMPAHGDRLSELQIRLLAVWLQNGQAE